MASKLSTVHLNVQKSIKKFATKKPVNVNRFHGLPSGKSNGITIPRLQEPQSLPPTNY